jgi:iron complex outermembrane receptor protein
MKRILAFISLFSFTAAYSQTKDTTQFGKDSAQLQDVIVIGKKSLDYQKESKPLSTIDEYMENSGKINLIKRGGYAWEPTLNNMATERISVTIDGMKIFEACTDRMDPVSSYVEISNLSSMQVNSGMQSGCHGGTSIGGGIDMKLNKAGFDSSGWKTALNTGYETNGNYYTAGGNAAYSGAKFYSNFGIFYRKSGDYKAGGNTTILFSQFQKANAYGNFGYRFSKSRTIEASVIGDNASNVGYPALTMDVKTARAIITSLSYKKENISDVLKKWETKLYFNSIVHKMDDTKRPDVPIHMDMPGWSKTSGFYSQLNGRSQNDSFTVNLDGYYNQSKADMTMYPKDSSEKLMFMYT